MGILTTKLVGRLWHSSVLDVRSCVGTDCDTGHCMVVAKVRERLAVGKRAVLKFDVDRCTLRKLSELEIMKQYQIEITNSFADLESISKSEDINRAWENIKNSIKTSAKESLCMYNLKKHKPLFDEECSLFLDQGSGLKCSGYRIQTKAM